MVGKASTMPLVFSKWKKPSPARFGKTKLLEVVAPDTGVHCVQQFFCTPTLKSLFGRRVGAAPECFIAPATLPSVAFAKLSQLQAHAMTRVNGPTIITSLGKRSTPGGTGVSILSQLISEPPGTRQLRYCWGHMILSVSAR